MIRIAITIVLLFIAPAQYSSAEPTVLWSNWKTLDDNANNGISFSYKCYEGTCSWRWKNAYASEITIDYSIGYSAANGKKQVKTDRVTLQRGENESASYQIFAGSLTGVKVGVVASEQVLAKARMERKKREYREQEQARIEEQQREEARIAEQQREQRAEERAAQDRAHNEEMKQIFMSGMQGVADEVTRGAQRMQEIQRQHQEAERRQRLTNARIQRQQQEDTRREQEEARRRQQAKERGQLRREEEARKNSEENRRVAEQEQKRQEVETKKNQGRNGYDTGNNSSYNGSNRESANNHSDNRNVTDSNRYQRGGEFNNCVSVFYDPDMYKWYSFRNDCNEAIYVAFRGRNSGNIAGAMSLKPGRKGSIGSSQNEVMKVGGVISAVCRDGYIPVNATGEYWRSGKFKCKKN